MKPRYDPNFTVQAAAYEALAKNLDAWQVRVPPNGRVLLVNDPFPGFWINPMFLINLHSHTTEAVVNRLSRTQFLPPEAEIAGYDYVIDYDAAWLLLKRPGNPLAVSPHLRALPENANVLLRDGFEAPDQGLWRGTAPVFTIETRAADVRPHALAVSLVSYTPAMLSVQVDDGAPHALGVQPVPNIELKLPIPPAPQVHTLTFRGASAAHVFLVDARLE
jgi:hypothetical protein